VDCRKRALNSFLPLFSVVLLLLLFVLVVRLEAQKHRHAEEGREGVRV